MAFRSLTEHMDTTSPQGELLFAVFGTLAQYERALIRERVIAGLQAAATRGRRGGRPRAISDETLAEPPRVPRRRFRLASYAAIAATSSCS